MGGARRRLFAETVGCTVVAKKLHKPTMTAVAVEGTGPHQPYWDGINIQWQWEAFKPVGWRQGLGNRNGHGANGIGMANHRGHGCEAVYIELYFALYRHAAAQSFFQ